MSYCRFSCDSFRSNVYAYFGMDGYVVHVAGSKRVLGEGQTEWPRMPEVFEENFVEDYEKFHKAIDQMGQVQLEHPEAGCTRSFDTPQELLQYLQHLRDTGLHVPDHAFYWLNVEAEMEDE